MYIDDKSHECSPSWANLLRKRCPSTSFPSKMSDESLANMGIHEIKPALRKVGVEYIKCDPQLIDGVWTEILEAK